MKKRLLSILLLLVFVLSAAACGEKQEAAAEPAEASASAESGDKKTAGGGLSQLLGGGEILCVNCKIDGQDSLKPEKGKAYIAQAVLPAGMAVDHWELNGREVDNQGRKYSLNFVASDYALVNCVLRSEYSVKSINASMQLLDKKGRPAGLFFTECNFESDYFNYAAEDVYPGGRISVHVRADVPEGMVVDYWKINDVPYFFQYPISEFTALDLYETTVYEAVFRGEKDKPTSPEALMLPPGTTPGLPGDVPFGVEEFPEEGTATPEPLPSDPPEVNFPVPSPTPSFEIHYIDPGPGLDPLPIVPVNPDPVKPGTIPPDSDMPDEWYPPENFEPLPGAAPPNIGTEDRPDYPNHYLPTGPDDPDCPPDYLGPWADGTVG